MSLITLISRKFRSMTVAVVAVIFAMTMGGCGNSIDDYSGTWIGLDERGGPHATIHQYEIVPGKNESEYIIRVTTSDYEVTPNATKARWRSTEPHMFSGRLDPKGNLITDIGVIKADPRKFRLIYGNIFLVRKAKNTELKLKYVIRDSLKAAHPEIAIED